MTTSTSKFSIAGYMYSSTVLESLWISSIKRISPSSRFVSTPTRSPARCMAGPLVEVIFVPISCAIICAKDVLPNPGGPESKACSNGSFLFLAASSETFKLSTAPFCPINSLNLEGLNESIRIWSSSVSWLAINFSLPSMFLTSFFICQLSYNYTWNIFFLPTSPHQRAYSLKPAAFTPFIHFVQYLFTGRSFRASSDSLLYHILRFILFILQLQ